MARLLDFLKLSVCIILIFSFIPFNFVLCSFSFNTQHPRLHFLPTKAEAVSLLELFFNSKLCSHEIDLVGHKQHFFLIIKRKK